MMQAQWEPAAGWLLHLQSLATATLLVVSVPIASVVARGDDTLSSDFFMTCDC